MKRLIAELVLAGIILHVAAWSGKKIYKYGLHPAYKVVRFIV